MSPILVLVAVPLVLVAVTLSLCPTSGMVEAQAWLKPMTPSPLVSLRVLCPRRRRRW